MDSVTQVALGAAVGEATLGRRVGRRAVLWGGICGLFPDLDVLYPYADAVAAFTYHRGPSHSVFILTALTPVFVWLIGKSHPDARPLRRRWYLLVFIAFVTHILLDSLTVYGTQILWPIPTPPVMWSTIFIIDPVYSIPLFLGVLAAVMVSRRRQWGHRTNAICLVLTTLYLTWSVGAKLYVSHLVSASLNQQGIAYERMVTIPSPFNTVLWRVLAMNETGYLEGYYSLLDDAKTVRVKHYPSDESLLDTINDRWSVKRLQWFTHGFYSVRREGNTILMTDLRMGMEPYYVFQFRVGTVNGSQEETLEPAPVERVRTEAGWNRLSWVWQRIWTPDPPDEIVSTGRNPGCREEIHPPLEMVICLKY